MTQEEIDKYRREEQARYAREWRKNNPQRAKEIKARYWAKKAAKLKKEKEEKENEPEENKS